MHRGHPEKRAGRRSARSYRCARCVHWIGPLESRGRRKLRRFNSTVNSGQGCAVRTGACGNVRLKTVQVIDRGPFARRVTWDLTRATAQDLGVRQTSRVHALH